jgi:protein ImuB
MFAVLLLPSFRLQAALRCRRELSSQPVAVTDPETGAILEFTAAAEAQGVRAGLPAVQALARCPELTLLPRAFATEHVVRNALLEVGASLSPSIEATADGCCTVDLRGAKVNDWNHWCSDAVARLVALELEAKVGVAPNPDLAFLAARKGAPSLVVQAPAVFLAQLALSEIDPLPHLQALLHDWGVHTLGQLTSLPRGELSARLGPDAERLWQRASGQTERLLRLERPVEEYSEAFDFEHEIETTEPLLFILRRFLDQLTLRLENAHRVAARLVLTLPLEDGGTHERLFTIPSPTGDAEVLFRVLQTHLETLQLEKRPTGVRLRVEPVRPGHQQFRLFETALRDPNRFGETLGRLGALVGVENVGVAEIGDSYRPDHITIAEPCFHEMGEGSANPPLNLAIGLPLRRFRPPIPADVLFVRHVPVQVTSSCANGRIVDLLGPYRASGEWWEREQWSVEEWDVDVGDTGLFRLRREPGGWFIEGCYDADAAVSQYQSARYEAAVH